MLKLLIMPRAAPLLVLKCRGLMAVKQHRPPTYRAMITGVASSSLSADLLMLRLGLQERRKICLCRPRFPATDCGLTIKVVPLVSFYLGRGLV